MRIAFLGTGSGGSRQRYHTCIYIELESNKLFLDASSGNSALVNSHKLGINLGEIDHLLLSHSHHDHARGLEYLESYQNDIATKEALNVYGSEKTLLDVQGFFQFMDKPFVVNDEGVVRNNNLVTLKWHTILQGRTFEINNMMIKAHDANHIEGAMGWRLECGNESVVFSGDTQFTENTIQAARGSTVLIHEAYGLKQDAERLKIVKHSSAYDAGLVAAESHVEQLIITHISSAYHGKESLLLEEASKVYSGPIMVAYDLMDITI